MSTIENYNDDQNMSTIENYNDDQNREGIPLGIKIGIGFVIFLILLFIGLLVGGVFKKKTTESTTKATTKATPKATPKETTKATTSDPVSKTFNGKKFDKIMFNYSKNWSKGDLVSHVTTLDNKSLKSDPIDDKGFVKTKLILSEDNYVEVLKPIGYNKTRRLYVEYDTDGRLVSLHVTKVTGNTGTINESCEDWIAKNSWTNMYYNYAYPSEFKTPEEYTYVEDGNLFVYTTLTG